MSLMPLGLLSQGVGGGIPNIAGSFELISTQTLASTTTSINFNSIPSTYTHLQLRVSAKSDNTTTKVLVLTFNGDTTSTYNWHDLYSNGTSVVSTNSGGSVGLISVPNGTPPSTTANLFGATIIDIAEYTNINKLKVLKALSSQFTSSTDRNVELSAGIWRSTAAITSITLATTGQSFVANSRFSLYGIKGA